MRLTVDAIEAKIREINENITELMMMPGTMTVKGISASYANKITELQAERAHWMDELRKAQAKEAGRSPLQGPDLKV